MKKILSLFILLCLFACRDKRQPGRDSNDSTSAMKPVKDTNLVVNLFPDTAVAPIYGYVEGGKAISCYLKVSKPLRIEAELVPLTSGLNLRFNQLFIPGGTADGPFGSTLAYNLDKSGTYRLVLAPNLMAEGQTTGEYLVRFRTQ